MSNNADVISNNQISTGNSTSTPLSGHVWPGLQPYTPSIPSVPFYPYVPNLPDFNRWKDFELINGMFTTTTISRPTDLLVKVSYIIKIVNTSTVLLTSEYVFMNNTQTPKKGVYRTAQACNSEIVEMVVDEQKVSKGMKSKASVTVIEKNNIRILKVFLNEWETKKIRIVSKIKPETFHALKEIYIPTMVDRGGEIFVDTQVHLDFDVVVPNLKTNLKQTRGQFHVANWREKFVKISWSDEKETNKQKPFDTLAVIVDNSVDMRDYYETSVMIGETMLKNADCNIWAASFNWNITVAEFCKWGSGRTQIETGEIFEKSCVTTNLKADFKHVIKAAALSGECVKVVIITNRVEKMSEKFKKFLKAHNVTIVTVNKTVNNWVNVNHVTCLETDVLEISRRVLGGEETFCEDKQTTWSGGARASLVYEKLC